MNCHPKWPLLQSLVLTILLCPLVLADDDIDSDDDYLIRNAEWHADTRTLVVKVDSDDDVFEWLRQPKLWLV